MDTSYKAFVVGEIAGIKSIIKSLHQYEFLLLWEMESKLEYLEGILAKS